MYIPEIVDLTKSESNCEIIDLTKEEDETKEKRTICELCPICYDDLGSNVGYLMCGHYFCYQCIYKWSQTFNRNSKSKIPQCPICRRGYAGPQISSKTFNKYKSIIKNKVSMTMDSCGVILTSKAGVLELEKVVVKY
jgi:hypothetical protein